MENAVNQRIAFFIESTGKTVNFIAKKIGITQQSLYAVYKGQGKPSFNTIQKLIEIYDINPEWLISGKGEMLKNNQTNENINGNTGIVGNNVNGGGINDTAVMNEIVKMLNKKDEQIDRLLSLLEERKTNAK